MRALFFAVAVVFFASGCSGSDCEFACDKAKECGGQAVAGTFFGNASCDDLCDLSEDFAETINCESQFDAFMACSARQLPSDGCVPTTVVDCTAENLAYSQCFGVDDNN